MHNNQTHFIWFVALLLLLTAGITVAATAAGKPADAPIRFAIWR